MKIRVASHCAPGFEETSCEADAWVEHGGIAEEDRWPVGERAKPAARVVIFAEMPCKWLGWFG